MTAKHDCSVRVWHDYHSVACSRTATVWHNGAWYCWQHDPEYVEAKKLEHRATWQAKMDREAEKYAKIARNARLGTLVTEETVELIEGLADIADRWEYSDTAGQARALATRIREALEDRAE